MPDISYKVLPREEGIRQKKGDREAAGLQLCGRPLGKLNALVNICPETLLCDGEELLLGRGDTAERVDGLKDTLGLLWGSVTCSGWMRIVETYSELNGDSEEVEATDGLVDLLTTGDTGEVDV